MNCLGVTPVPVRLLGKQNIRVRDTNCAHEADATNQICGCCSIFKRAII
ncbi:hypothetical protein HMPREF0972_00477 [Actinomyces sp. oral taxon 848 str. F0332]|nr:hypothetical protein HMPREF0972_00477 [Actinomyces sp. oral taxon 848 str. F0332]